MIGRQVWRSFKVYGKLLSEPSSLAFEKGTAMKKTLMALAAVATLTASTASPAHAGNGWWGPGVAAGLIGGAIVGGAIASSPYYYGPGYYGPGYGYYGPAYSGGPYGPVTGSISASGTASPGACATCASAADVQLDGMWVTSRFRDVIHFETEKHLFSGHTLV